MLFRFSIHCSYSNTSREALSSFLRIVGVSATLPNVSSIAAFLEVNEAYAFDASYRPVPLTTHVVGLGSAGKNAFMFGKSLDRHVPDLIKRFSQSKPTIVFCHTKKETETLAMTLSNMNGIAIRNCDNMALAGQTKLASLQRPLIRGIAYHHAGLDAPDRKLVETAFMKGKVIVLCATSTLAMGVNLPAHLVVIKGTSAWRGAEQGHQEIDKGTLLQMMGRAGRPGFDTSGIAVIMTDNVSKMKYEQLSGGMEVVESRLPSRLMDVLNTEISQRVITSLDTAQDWLKSTFFYRRVTENPRHYGLPSSEPHVEEYMEKLCLSSLELLNELGIIRFDDSGNVSPLMGCHVMSQHMVEFEAMKSIVGLPFDADQATLLKFLAECDRLHRPVRRGEKKALNEVHKLIRYKLDGPPSKVRVQSPWEKTFVLLQAAIGQHYLEEKTLRQEMSFMVEYATRILSAVEDYSIDGSMNGQVSLQSLRLRRSLATCLWGPGDGVLNQLRGVGHKTTAKLRFSKISSFVDVLSATSEAIERAAGRAPPFGKELRTAVSKILAGTLQLSACLEYEGSVSKYVVCSLARRATMPGAELVDSDESAGIIKYTLVVYTDRPGGSLVVQPNITSIGEYRFPCPQTFGKIFVHLVASMVGLDGKSTTLNHCLHFFLLEYQLTSSLLSCLIQNVSLWMEMIPFSSLHSPPTHQKRPRASERSRLRHRFRSRGTTSESRGDLRESESPNSKPLSRRMPVPRNSVLRPRSQPLLEHQVQTLLVRKSQCHRRQHRLRHHRCLPELLSRILSLLLRVLLNVLSRIMILLLHPARNRIRRIVPQCASVALAHNVFEATETRTGGRKIGRRRWRLFHRV